MLRSETQEQSDFRQEVRRWLNDHLPDHLRFLTFRPLPAGVRTKLSRKHRSFAYCSRAAARCETC
jgi:hypothetical protein